MFPRITPQFIVIAFCLVSQLALGQKLKKPVKITGEVGVYGDFYHLEPTVAGAITPRRPDFLGRLVVNTSLSFKDFSMPITMALPSAQYGVIVPTIPPIPNAPLTNIRDLIKNPLNRIGIAPKYKWGQLLLGSQTPQYSELSVGDLPVFGTGINLTPGKLRFSCFSGTSQLAIEQDASRNFQGIYARKIYSAKIGWGHQDSSHIYLIGSMMKDDTSSLHIKPAGLMPQAGALASLDFRINLPKKIYVKGELASSVFTRNTRYNDESGIQSQQNRISHRTESSRTDYASVLSIGKDGKNYGIKVVGRYYGDGFVPMGYPFLQTDRLEVTVDPRFTFLKNKLQVSGSLGRRVNNLSGTRSATTTQTIGAVNMNMLFTKNFSLAASYSNFGFRNTILNDTFKLEMVTLCWSISPSYTFKTKKSQHNFTLMYARNIFNDFNTITGAMNDNNGSNGVLSYMLTTLKKPFSVSTFLTYFDNSTAYGRLLTKAVRVNVGYKFFKNKLNATAGLMVADNTLDANTSGFQVMTLLGAKYTMNKKLFFSLNGSVNTFDYGAARPGLSYRENFLRTSITYKF